MRESEILVEFNRSKLYSANLIHVFEKSWVTKNLSHFKISLRIFRYRDRDSCKFQRRWLKTPRCNKHQHKPPHIYTQCVNLHTTCNFVWYGDKEDEGDEELELSPSKWKYFQRHILRKLGSPNWKRKLKIWNGMGKAFYFTKESASGE